MTTTMAALDPCILAYHIATSPAPLQVSTPRSKLTAVINVAVACPVFKSIYCNQIDVAVPIGPGATDLFGAPPAVSVNTDKWVVSTPTQETDLWLDEPTKYAIYTFTCRDPKDYLINYPLVLGLVGVVNEVTGESRLVVREISGTSSDPKTFTPKSTTYFLDKVMQAPFLQNFVTTTTAAPTVPATEFANGQPIRLIWESNGVLFQLYRKTDTAPIYTGTASIFTLEKGLSTDTTFVLVATFDINPSLTDMETVGRQIFLYDWLTVTISNPDLKPRSVDAGSIHGQTLAIDKTATVGGNTTIGTPAAAAMLQVNGDTQLKSVSATGMTVSGSVTAGGMKVSGDTNLGALSAGQITASGIQVSGTAQVGYLKTGSSTLGYADAVQLYLNGGRVTVNNVGDDIAVRATNGSDKYGSGYFQNTKRHSDRYINGVISEVASGDDWGFGTNGKITTNMKTTIFTHLPFAGGYRVVTAPMSLEVELQISGHARLHEGVARVMIAHESAPVAELIHHSQEYPYRVFLTPLGHCNGLAVTEKSADHFMVEELNGGRSNAEFDWFLIARRPEEMVDGSGITVKTGKPYEMPERLPEFKRPADDKESNDK